MVFQGIKGHLCSCLLIVTCCLICLWVNPATAEEQKTDVPPPSVEQVQPPENAAPSPDPSTDSVSAQAQTPAQSQKAKLPTSNIKLFGTEEFAHPKSLPGWARVVERNLADPIFVDNKRLVDFDSTTWAQFKANAKKKKGLELFRYVNEFWNKSKYILDIKNWGVDDYWATPAEFNKKSGDCEDYAIVKYFTLKELGVPPEQMRIVALRSSLHNNQGHAVLVVYFDNDAFVLDNMSKAVLSHSKLHHYHPQYSINEIGRWGHYPPKKKK